METEKINRINAFLSKHNRETQGMSEEHISQLSGQLDKVDDALLRRLADIKQAQDLLKGRPINTQIIAELSGISRKTFYNNELLGLYIKEFDIPTINSEKLQLQRAKDKCSELEKQVHMFLIRDVETENLKHENQKLQLEIEHLKTQIKGQDAQIEKLIKENDRLQSLTPKGIVLPFKPKE